MAHVTVSDITPRVDYTVGAAPQSAFTIPATWGFFALTDFQVYVGGALATYTASPTTSTQYSVAGTAVDGGYQGGTVTLGATVTNTSVAIVRDVPTARTEDFPYPSPTLNIKTLNTGLDKIAAWAQQLKLKFTRALRQPDDDSATIGALPNKATRASKYLGFDAGGDPIPLAAPAGTTAVSAFMATVLDDTDAATARATLGAISQADALALLTFANMPARVRNASRLALFNLAR
jgi:hypothetical protein